MKEKGKEIKLQNEKSDVMTFLKIEKEKRKRLRELSGLRSARVIATYLTRYSLFFHHFIPLLPPSLLSSSFSSSSFLLLILYHNAKKQGS